MYMAGRLRTASRPSRTLILSAPYSSTEPFPFGPAAGGVLAVRRASFCWSCSSGCSTRVLNSNPHRHDHVGVVVTLRADGLHDGLAHVVLERQRYAVGF